jgi:hypothetical protein
VAKFQYQPPDPEMILRRAFSKQWQSLAHLLLTTHSHDLNEADRSFLQSQILKRLSQPPARHLARLTAIATRLGI